MSKSATGLLLAYAILTLIFLSRMLLIALLFPFQMIIWVWRFLNDKNSRLHMTKSVTVEDIFTNRGDGVVNLSEETRLTAENNDYDHLLRILLTRLQAVLPDISIICDVNEGDNKSKHSINVRWQPGPVAKVPITIPINPNHTNPERPFSGEGRLIIGLRLDNSTQNFDNDILNILGNQSDIQDLFIGDYGSRGKDPMWAFYNLSNQDDIDRVFPTV